uniref:Uncharacterized protein n=1 Tax=Steinernema glaseri TaxID=37863 RepID=A0A1I8ACG8_9BILA
MSVILGLNDEGETVEEHGTQCPQKQQATRRGFNSFFGLPCLLGLPPRTWFTQLSTMTAELPNPQVYSHKFQDYNLELDGPMQRHVRRHHRKRVAAFVAQNPASAHSSHLFPNPSSSRSQSISYLCPITRTTFKQK